MPDNTKAQDVKMRQSLWNKAKSQLGTGEAENNPEHLISAFCNPEAESSPFSAQHALTFEWRS